MMITVATFDNPLYAKMFCSHLEEAGIRACVNDAEVVGMNWLFSNAIGGIKVQILEEDLERVRSLLKEHDEIPGRYIFLPKPSCPACRSTRLQKAALGKWMLALSLLFLGFPLLFRTPRFHCLDCGAIWKVAELREANTQEQAEETEQPREE